MRFYNKMLKSVTEITEGKFIIPTLNVSLSKKNTKYKIKDYVEGLHKFLLHMRLP